MTVHHGSNYQAPKAPKDQISVRVTPQVWSRIRLLTQMCAGEVSGLMLVDEKDPMLITDLFVPKQVNTDSNTELDMAEVGNLMLELTNEDEQRYREEAKDAARWQAEEAEEEFDEDAFEVDEEEIEYRLENEGRCGRLKGWWHSHANAGVFWSPTDVSNIERLEPDGYLISIVTNKKGDKKCRVDLFDLGGVKFRLVLEDLPVITDEIPPEAYEWYEEIADRIEYNAKEPEKKTTGSGGTASHPTSAARGATARAATTGGGTPTSQSEVHNPVTRTRASETTGSVDEAMKDMSEKDVDEEIDKLSKATNVDCRLLRINFDDLAENEYRYTEAITELQAAYKDLRVEEKKAA